MRKQTGIKLILLIITIILILILAGLVINLTIDENEIFKVAKYDKNDNKTEVSYEIVEKVETKYKVVIVVKNDIGIQKLECPNGLEITCNNKNKITIDYEVTENIEHEFTIGLSNKEEKFIININSANEIKINENTSYAYPIITEDGITIGKTVSIVCEETPKLYYSLDNGNTWLEYDREIKFLKEGNIKAKIVQNGITQIVSKNITLNLASDAIQTTAYDGDYKSADILKSYYQRKIIVDSSMRGKTIWITAAETSDPRVTAWLLEIYAYLDDGSNSRIYKTLGKDQSYTRRGIVIPQNVQYLIFKVGSANTCKWELREIEVK